MEIFYKKGKVLFCFIIVSALTCFSQEGCCFLRGMRRKTHSLLREVKKLPGGGMLDIIETAIKPSSSKRKKTNTVLVTTPDYSDNFGDPESRLDNIDIKLNKNIGLVDMIIETQKEIEGIYNNTQTKNQNNIDIMKKIINVQNKMIKNQIDIINTQNNTLSYIKKTQSRMAGYYSFLTIIGVGAIILLNMNNVPLEQR